MLQHYSYIYSVPYLVYFFFLLLTMLKEFVYLNKRQEKKKLDLLVLGSLIVFFWITWIRLYRLDFVLSVLFETSYTCRLGLLDIGWYCI